MRNGVPTKLQKAGKYKTNRYFQRRLPLKLNFFKINFVLPHGPTLAFRTQSNIYDGAFYENS